MRRGKGELLQCPVLAGSCRLYSTAVWRLLAPPLVPKRTFQTGYFGSSEAVTINSRATAILLFCIAHSTNRQVQHVVRE
jgi:hypothetical protein